MNLKEAILLDCKKTLENDELCDSCLGNMLLIISKIKENKINEKHCGRVLLEANKKNELCECKICIDNIQEFKKLIYDYFITI